MSVVSRLHLVTDAGVLEGEDFFDRASEALEAGEGKVTLHLRGPKMSGRALWELGSRLLPLARARSVPLMVNDRVDLARVLAAAGAHLGARSLPVSMAREVLGPEALVGRSFHDPSDARSAVLEEGKPDFCFAGTLFPTQSHPGAEGSGPSRVREVAGAVPGVPVLGIGGVEISRIAAVMDAGAYGVAVLRAVWGSEEPGEAVTALLDRLSGWTG